MLRLLLTPRPEPGRRQGPDIQPKFGGLPVVATCTISSLPDNPTKAQELDHWRTFVEALPAGSYLADMFADSFTLVGNMIRNDIAFPLIPELVKERDFYRAEAAEQEKRRNELRDEVIALEARARKAEREADNARDRLEAIKSEARVLCR